MTAETAPDPAPQTPPGQDSRPVLKDASEVEYRVHSLNGRRFLQAPEALKAVTRDGAHYQLLAGRVDVDDAAQLRDLDASRVPETALTDVVFRVSYTPPKGDTLTVPVSATDLDARDPQWPDTLGIRARTSKRYLENISNALRAIAATVENDRGWTNAYACTGPIRLESGEWAWLRPGKPALTATGTLPMLTTQLPADVATMPGVAVLDVDDPSPDDTAAEDLAALLRVLDLLPGQPEIPWALLALLEWAPFAPIPDLGRVAVALAGETGSRKTALSGVLVAAQSTTFIGGKGIEVPVPIKMRHNQSTTFATDQVLHPLAGLLANVDDWFAGRMTEKEIAEAWKRLSAIGDNVATGSGGARGGYRNGRGIVTKSKYPRCCILATCERLPDEAKHSSETARYVALEMRDAVNLDVLTEVQASGRALSRAHAALIRSGLANPDRVHAALEWGRQIAEGWDHGGHGRVTYGYARLLAGVRLIGHQIQDVLEFDPAPLINDAVDMLHQAAADQTRRSGMRGGRDAARDPVGLFVKHLRQALAADPFWVSAPDRDEGGQYLPPQVPGHGPPALGWRQMGESWQPAGKGDPIGVVVVHQDDTTGRPPWRPVMLRVRASRWQEVYDLIARRVIAEDGWTLPSPADLRARLAEAGYLKSAASVAHDLWGGKPKCYLLDLGRILDADDDEPGPEQHAETEPSPQPPLPAPSPSPGPCPACGYPVNPVVIDMYGGYHPMCAHETPTDAAAEAATHEPQQMDLQDALEPAQPPADPPTSERTPTTPAAGQKPSQRLDPMKAKETKGTGYQRRTYAYRLAVLDLDGLHLPGEADPQECPLPASKSAALELAERHDIKQLWLHPRAAAALNLPTPDDRDDIPTDAGSPHPWADDDAIQCDPEGVAPWMVVWPRGKSRDRYSRSIVLPHLETRAAWAYDGNGDPRQTDGRTLLRALEMFCDAIGADYYWSPNATTALLARRHCRTLKESVSHAILAQDVPPAAHYSKMLASKWRRPLTAQEQQARIVLRLDRNAAYLNAMNIPLGVGEPTYHEGKTPFTRKKAGYWRIAEPPQGLDPLLPELRFKPGRDGHVWLTTPDMTLLEDLGILPEVTAAWIWHDSRRVLTSLYDTIRLARAALLDGKTDGDEAAAIAYALTADLYKSFTGYLARNEGPRKETDKGPDTLWRPDWRDHILAEAGARMYRNLLDEAKGVDKEGNPKGSGRYPIGSYVDAAYYTSEEEDPWKARPAGLKYDPENPGEKPTGRGGAWKIEGYVPLANLGRAPGTPKFHERFDAEWEKIQKKEKSR